MSYHLSVREKKLLKIEPYLLVTSAHDKAQNKLTSYIKDNKLGKYQIDNSSSFTIT